MALATYTDLKASIAAWAHRTDLTAMMPDFVMMAEARIGRDLRLRKQITSATLTATAGARKVAIPADWLEFENVGVFGSGIHRPLTYVTVEHMDAKYDPTFVGLPGIYTIEGDNLLLAPTPDSAYSIDVIYYARFAALASANTNWLLTNHPNIYLFACLIEAMFYTHNSEQLNLYTQRYQQELAQLQMVDDRSTHSGSALRVRVI